MEDDENKKIEDQTLSHYGMPRRSGRYPWGSGETPYQGEGDFLSRIQPYRDKGMTDNEIAKELDISTTKFRQNQSLAIDQRKSDLVARIKSMQSDGLSNPKIAAELGLAGESTVRSLLASDAKSRLKIARKAADSIREIIDEKGMLDVGVGVERELGISREKLGQAIQILQEEGYLLYPGRVPQSTNKGKYTTIKVLCPPGTQHKEIYEYDKINHLTDYISRDEGDTFEPGFIYPSSLNSDRIQIRYAEEGGKEKDGVVELRRGVPDISLGSSNYAQVRILVDGTHYIKGMALYSDNMPEGVDIVFNTNKKIGTDKMKVLKAIKEDPDNPFGSAIKEHGGQSYYIDPVTGEKKLSVINKRADEGDWGEWSKELSSQFLSKQPTKMIEKQINLAMVDKNAEFNEIMSLTNPTVKKALLEAFADDCDSSAVHLKAASLPGTHYKVILPIGSLKDDETYAPHLKDGTQAALIRFPHGGTFEIPIVTVNNRNKEGISVLTPNPQDAIGINSKVAERLSGADFDGDTVMVIPLSETVKIKSTPALKGLQGFDTKMTYGPDSSKIGSDGIEHFYRGEKEISVMKESNLQLKMGIASNLITDMTLKGATDEEKTRAVKHSMVVIDAVKHHLDYKQSEIDNGIKALHKKYQGHIDPETGRERQGAATLISRAKSEVTINERKEAPGYFAKDTGNRLILVDEDNKVFLDEESGRFYSEKEKRTLYADPKTGEKLYKDTGREYTKVHYKDSTGKSQTSTGIVRDGRLFYKDEDKKWIEVTSEKFKTQLATMKSTRMAEAKDARELSSGTPQEELYATYANSLKALGNEARKAFLAIKEISYSPSARQTYQQEVNQLEEKLNRALLNAPKERYAQMLAATRIKAKLAGVVTLTPEQEKKIRQQELSRARVKVGAKRSNIRLEMREWEAIQAGAITKTRLEQIIANSDLDILRQLAMPRATTVLSDNKVRRLISMSASGYTSSEIADALNIPVSTISNYLRKEE